MTETTTKRSVFDDVKDLGALREELRLQAHLFKAEAKDKFEALEKHWREIQQLIRTLDGRSSSAAKEITAAARATIAELSEQYRGLKSDLARRK